MVENQTLLITLHVLEYRVSGDQLRVVDIPPGYTHAIENVGGGHLVLTGLDADVILNAVRLVVANHTAPRGHVIPAEYAVANTSFRVVKLILGTAKLGHLWDGLVAA